MACRGVKQLIIVLGLLRWHVWVGLLMWFGFNFVSFCSAPNKFWPFFSIMCDKRAETRKDSDDGNGCEGEMKVLCRVILLGG